MFEVISVYIEKFIVIIIVYQCATAKWERAYKLE